MCFKVSLVGIFPKRGEQSLISLLLMSSNILICHTLHPPDTIHNECKVISHPVKSVSQTKSTAKNTDRDKQKKQTYSRNLIRALNTDNFESKLSSYWCCRQLGFHLHNQKFKKRRNVKTITTSIEICTHMKYI